MLHHTGWPCEDSESQGQEVSMMNREQFEYLLETGEIELPE
jgi:hypothetical protein